MAFPQHNPLKKKEKKKKGEGARNDRAFKTKGEGNEHKNWVSGVIPWEIFVTVPLNLA